MAKALKNRASKQPYISPNQLILEGFETPFSQHLDSNNRWIILARSIPWDRVVGVYEQALNNHYTGASGINPRVAIGAVFIKHFCNLSDRETIDQIRENVYMQYFIGYSSFSNEEPFDPSLFVEIRKRLGTQQINLINELIMGVKQPSEKQQHWQGDDKNDAAQKDQTANFVSAKETDNVLVSDQNKGELIVDATACPQDIHYPTDLHLLNDAREKSEQIIDELYQFVKYRGVPKPRTYREIARKDFLKIAQKKIKSKKNIQSSLRRQLGYLQRNIGHINMLLDYCPVIPLDRKKYKYLLVIQTLYDQQREMYQQNKHSIAHRIVSIHQPHVRPIVRGKANAQVEFGAKIQVSIQNGFTFMEEISWEAYNEGTRLMETIKNYKHRFGCYPQKVMADKIYCTRENRGKLKELGISLRAKPLGRPTKAVADHVRPGERNPIEGKFGQAKTAYGLNRIKARLQHTSESWIASIILVLNLVKITGQSALLFIVDLLAFSASLLKGIMPQQKENKKPIEIFLFA
jgi:IS5 family transposase